MNMITSMSTAMTMSMSMSTAATITATITTMSRQGMRHPWVSWKKPVFFLLICWTIISIT